MKHTMKRVIRSNPRSNEYDDYLNTHISGVIRAWDEILEPGLLYDLNDHDMTVEDLSSIRSIISEHDTSKYESDEYDAYCNYFYPSDGFEKDEHEFNRAWLLHQKRNPHHWQYWILIRDNGDLEPMDMPIEYICEMLCDWHSFTLRDSKSTAYKWWNDNKDKMVLSKNTIDCIESMISYMKKPLSK